MLTDNMGDKASNASVRAGPYYHPVAQYSQPPRVLHVHVPSPPAPFLSEAIPFVHARLPLSTPMTTHQAAARYDCDDRSLFWKHFRPALPVLLSLSTVIGGLCMVVLQIPKLCEFTAVRQAECSIAIGILCVLVLCCMIYSTFVDPGSTTEQNLPRAHKTWLYGKKQPVRRFDRYEQWLQNDIGLSNHREFFVMLCGLSLIAAIGIIVDVWLLILIAETGETEVAWSEMLILVHFIYSLFLLVQSGRSVKIHAGLISRSELSQDFKRNKYRIVDDDVEQGICDEMFSRNSLVYDSSMNPFDKGCFTNWWKFWCQPRWCVDAKGDF